LIGRTLKDITPRRAELDRLEREEVKGMIRQDKGYQDLAGANLEEALAITKNIVQSIAILENETAQRQTLILQA